MDANHETCCRHFVRHIRVIQEREWSTNPDYDRAITDAYVSKETWGQERRENVVAMVRGGYGSWRKTVIARIENSHALNWIKHDPAQVY